MEGNKVRQNERKKNKKEGNGWELTLKKNEATSKWKEITDDIHWTRENATSALNKPVECMHVYK